MWMTSGWCSTTPGYTTAKHPESTSTAPSWLRCLSRRLILSCRALATVVGGRWDRLLDLSPDGWNLKSVLVRGNVGKNQGGCLALKGVFCWFWVWELLFKNRLICLYQPLNLFYFLAFYGTALLTILKLYLIKWQAGNSQIVLIFPAFPQLFSKSLNQHFWYGSACKLTIRWIEPSAEMECLILCILRMCLYMEYV